MLILNAKFLPLGLRTEDAESYVGTPDLFAAMRKAGWIETCMNWWRKPVLWSREDLQAACDRYIAGERPERPKPEAMAS